MLNPNLADVGKRPGGSARDAAAKRDAGNRETVTLTPAEVKAVRRMLGAKAQAVVSALREAGMIGAAKHAEIEAAQANFADVQAKTNSAKQHHDQILDSITSCESSSQPNDH
jgi:hypothetical protein